MFEFYNGLLKSVGPLAVASRLSVLLTMAGMPLSVSFNA